MEQERVIELNTGRITAHLTRGERILVDRVCFSLDAGESLALIGETGSGKTMTALSLMGLLPENVTQTGARMLYRGEDLPKGRKLRSLIGAEIVYIPQSGAESLNPSTRVGKQIRDGMKKNGIPAALQKTHARTVLEEVGFSDPDRIEKMYPFELSGGMAQRVTIALASLGRPYLILADEPTNGLDEAATDRFFALLNRLHPGAAKIVITHDISVARHCDRVIVLCGGRMCEAGPTEEVLSHPWHPYTAALIGALVKNGMRETPVLREGESPCPFYRRCNEAGIWCADEPVRHQLGSREWWCSKP